MMNETDLDHLADQALRWQKVLIENFAKIATLYSEKNDLKKSLSEAEEQILQRKAESSKLLGQVGDLQNIVAQRCDFEAENRKLKDQLIEQEKKLDLELKESRDNKAELQETIKTRELEFTTQISQLETKLKAEAFEEKSALERNLETKCAEMVELQQTTSQQETDHQQEMDNSKKEYEERLVKMKEQTVNLQNSASYNACKEIFRKKWEHAKSQYETEIAKLRAQIATLEDRLGRPRTQQGVQTRPRPLPAPRPTSGRGGGRGAGGVRSYGDFQPARSSTPTEGPPGKKRK